MKPSILPSSLAPLALPRLRRLLLAQVPADLADWLDFVALGALLAFHWQQGPMALAGLTMALGLPYVLLGPLAGVLVDRADLRTVLVLSNLGRAAATAAFAWAPDLATLLALAALKSSVDSLFTPAKQAALPRLAPPDRLMAANGLSHTVNQLTKVAGPALGGALVAVLAPQEVFFINAALSVLAAVLLLGLPRDLGPASEGGERESLRRQIGAGLAHFRGRPLLATATAAMALAMFVIFLHDGLVALLIRGIGYPEAMFGLAVAASGGGGVFGALLLGQFCERCDPLALMAAGGVFGGALLAAMGHVGRGDLVLSDFAFVALLFATGIASAAAFVSYRTVMQRETPVALLGRVATVGEAAMTAAMLAAPPLGALVANAAGVPAPFLLGGYLLMALGVGLALGRTRLARRPAA